MVVSDYAHRRRALWALFDDESDVGRIVLTRMEQIIREKLGEEGLPIHDQVVMEGECKNYKEMWMDMMEMLNNLEVEGARIMVLDKLRELRKSPEEIELMFVSRAYLVY